MASFTSTPADNETSQTTLKYIEDNDAGMTSEKVSLIVIGVFGVLSNGFATLVIATNKKMRSKICNFFILNQSIIDFFGSLFLACNNNAITSLKQPSNWVAAQLYCRFWASSYLMWAMFETSSYNLVGITIERYVEVVHPFSYPVLFSRLRAQLAIACIWVAGLLTAVFPNVIPSPPGENGICHRYDVMPDSQALRMFMRCMYAILFTLGPTVVMAVCYTKMAFVMRSKVAPEQSLSEAEKARELRKAQAKRNLLKTMVIVSAAFFLCWILNAFYGFMGDLGLWPWEGTFYSLTVYLVFINCVINPVIYTAQYKEFKDSVRSLFYRIIRQRVVRAEASTSSGMHN